MRRQSFLRSDDNRVYKSSTVNSVTTNQRFIVDIAGRLPTILCVIDGDDGSLERSYIYSGAQPIAFYEGSNDDPNYFYLHDRLGSVRQVLDTSGNVVNTYTYTPFGRDPNSQFAETVDNPFQFTGQWYDSEIDQYYLRARQYEPQLMRSTSIDPVFGRPDRSLTLHKYLYCTNDPINLTDPSGEFAVFGFVDLLVDNVLSAELRSTHSSVLRGMYNKAEGYTTSFSQMNLERGMMYDITVQNIEGDLKATMVDAGLANVKLYSENAARWGEVIREVWEAKEVWDPEEWKNGDPEFDEFEDYSWNLLLDNWFGLID